MIKYIVIAMNIFGIIFISLTHDDVQIEIDAPTEVNAGEDFLVKVTIKKYNIERFARFYQELPLGLTASEVDSKNAMFSFKDQKAKFLWIPGSLPEEEEFTITYSIHVDEQIYGTVEIGGQFIYIKDNDRVTLDLTPKSINVISNNFASNDSTNQNGTSANSYDSTKVLSCVRQKPFMNSKGEVIINLLINKGNLQDDKFAKIQEEIPAGYTAENIENKGGIFTVQNNTVKYLWMNLPAEQEFVVSYKLKPDAGVNVNDLAINGSFSYVENDKTLSIDVNEKTDIESDVLLAHNTQYNTTTEPDTSSQNLVAGNNTTNNTDNTNNTTDNNTNNDNNTGDITNTPDPDKNGVAYSIQICALRNYRKPQYFNQASFKLNDKVNLENHNGWNKYTIGSYSEYKDARDYRVNIWNSTPIKDAFVSAYNGGKRITVQEALMITNQKWVQ